MARRQTDPIINHTEIYSRAIRNILDEIKSWEDRCKNLPKEERDSIISEFSAPLTPKLDALKELYRIESGNEYS